MGRTSLESLGKRVQTRDQMPVYVTWNVVEYRQAAERYVKAGDVVLEVGCCGGATTAVIGKIAACVVGIDQTEAEIMAAKKRYGHPGVVEFEVMDAFDIPSLMKLEKSMGKRFNKVFVDINGSRDIPTLWRLIDKLKNVLKPELFIVKSVKIRMMLKQCVQYEEADEEVVDTQDKRQKAGDPEGQDAWRERHDERKPGEEGAEADEKTCPACGVYDSTEISEEKVLGVVEWASIAVGSVVLFLLGVRVGKAL